MKQGLKYYQDIQSRAHGSRSLKLRRVPSKSCTAHQHTWMLWAVLILILVASLWFLGLANGIWQTRRDVWWFVYAGKTGIEVVACVFAVFYMLVASNYRRPSHPRSERGDFVQEARVAVVYLCCDDLQGSALRSIVQYCGGPDRTLIVHDDSRSDLRRRQVDRIVCQIACEYGQDMQVIRRPVRSGGKPGALNNVLNHLSEDIQYLVIFDNDSFAFEHGVIERCLPYFDDPRVGLVQFRSVSKVFDDEGLGYKVLSSSIDFYDAFVLFMDRFGWSPFLGHNAMLRVSAIRQVGAFTEGQLADDIDFSVKLRLHGYRIRYARDIACGERHPATYEALRMRTRKWAYGCTQVILRWGLRLILSTKIGITDKATFFLTVGYYHFQALLLIYLLLAYAVIPLDETRDYQIVSLMVTAGFLLFFTFFPSIVYFGRKRQLYAWPRAAVYWGFTYGSQDFVIFKGILRCLLGESLSWTPTNAVGSTLRVGRVLPELLFGFLILAILLRYRPALFMLPTTFLFVGKFLLTPFLNNLIFSGARSHNPSTQDRIS